MSRTIANLDIASDTFGSWVSKTNQIAYTFEEVVTIKANTAGDATSGNGFVVGVFGANTITATSIRGGNVTSSSNLAILSNTAIGNASSQTSVSHNAIGHIKTTSYTTTNTDAQIIDSFAATEFRTSKYLISIKNTDDDDYQSTEIMLLQDGSSAYLTEYATLISTATLGVFSANVNSGTVRLYMTPTMNNNIVNFQRTSLVV
jgi:hypothetical protein